MARVELTPGRQALAESVAAAAVGGHGRLLEVTDKDLALRALEMHASGCSYKKIKRELGVGWPTFMRLKVDHEEALGVRQKEAAREAAMLHAKTAALLSEKLDRMQEDPDELSKVSFRDMAVGFGVLTDKVQLLNGAPTGIVEERSGLTLKEAAEFLDELKKRKRDRERVVDVEEVDGC